MRRSNGREPLPLVLAVLSAGCAMTDAVSRPIRSDSSGVERVVSSGTDQPLHWAFERQYVITADELAGPLPPIWPGAIGADLQGNLYVLDAPGRRVIVFDSTGQMTRVLGHAGGDAGEFRAPETLTVSRSGEVHVFDWGKDAFVRFDAQGNPLPDLFFPYHPTPSTVQRHSSVGAADYVVATTTRTASGRAAALFRLTASDTQVLRTIPLPEARVLAWRGCGGSLDLPPLFWPELVWDADARRIAVSTGTGYVVSIIDDGRTVRSIRRSIRPRTATRGLAMQELGAGLRINISAVPCTIPPYEVVSRRGFAKTIPPIENVRLAPEGEVWVQRSAVGPDASGWIDVFDVTGQYAGTLPSGTRLPLVFLPNQRAALLHTGANGANLIEVVRLNRKASASAAAARNMTN